MRKIEKVAWAGTSVVVLVIAIMIVLTAATNKQLAESMAKFEKPAAIELYEQLSAEPSETTAVPGETQPYSPQVIESARSTIAAWAQLFDHKSSWLLKTEQRPERLQFLYTRDESTPDPPPVPDALLKEIHECAQLGGPVCELDFGKGWSRKLQHHIHLTDCAVLVAEHARLMFAHERYAEGAQDIIAAMKVADALEEEPLLYSQETRQHIYSSLQTYLENIHLPQEQAIRIVEQLNQADDRPGVRRALAGEMHSWMASLQVWEDDANFSRDVDRHGLYWGTRNYLWVKPVCKPWLNRDSQARADITARMIEALESPYYKVHPVLAKIKADIDELPYVKYTAQIFLRRNFHVSTGQASHEARIDVMQLGVMLEAYRTQHAVYPKTLDVIAEALGGSLPVNPFTGSPYNYEVDDKGFFLYGQGPPSEPDDGPAWRGRYPEKHNDE